MPLTPNSRLYEQKLEKARKRYESRHAFSTERARKAAEMRFSTPAPKATILKATSTNANLRGANLIQHDNNRASILSGIAEATGVPGANRAYSSFLGGPPVKSNWDYVDAATLPLSILAEAAAIPADIATGSPLPSAGVTAGLIGLRQLARRGIPAGFKAIDPGIGLARKVPSFIGKNWNRTGDVAEGSNQYFTQARARSSLSAGTGISYNTSTGVISTSQNLTTAGSPTFAGLTLTGNVDITGSIIPSAELS